MTDHPVTAGSSKGWDMAELRTQTPDFQNSTTFTSHSSSSTHPAAEAALMPGRQNGAALSAVHNKCSRQLQLPMTHLPGCLRWAAALLLHWLTMRPGLSATAPAGTGRDGPWLLHQGLQGTGPPGTRCCLRTHCLQAEPAGLACTIRMCRKLMSSANQQPITIKAFL